MWVDLDKEQRVRTLQQLSFKTGLPNYAIEKDWWVCMVLRAVYLSKYAPYIKFKGGTSLSKSYNLIERFSEDVDLVIDRKLLGYDKIQSKTQIKKLRKASGGFIINEFREELCTQLNKLGLEGKYTIDYNKKIDDTSDPNTLEIVYKSVLDFNTNYIKPKVLLEMSARSQAEPSQTKEIISWLDEAYAHLEFSSIPFDVETILPQRTFLEKILLLHEEFRKPVNKIRTNRISRHLYDIEKIASTTYGKQAMEDNILFNEIVEHRKNITPLRGEDYSQHKIGLLNILPPDTIEQKWKRDYIEMQQNMISGDSLSWEKLIERMAEIQKQINSNW